MNQQQFKLPEGKSEAEVLEAIEKVVRALAPSFVFGYYSLEDIQQHARLVALKGLSKYDNVRPLENFLYVRVRNLLKNLYRDVVRRNDPPCRKCHEGNFCNQGSPCRKYEHWRKRNNDKANLVRPTDIASDEECQASMLNSAEFDVEQRELLELIDVKLPVELRAAYNQIRAGVSVPKAVREKVFATVKEILGDAL